jgi:hypothetical protein
MPVHLIGDAEGALFDVPAACAFHAVLRVHGEAVLPQPRHGDSPDQLRHASERLIDSGVIDCPRKGRIIGEQCADCVHLIAWRTDPELMLWCASSASDPVGDWMRHDPPTVAPSLDCREADELARVADTHHLLVLDSERCLNGVVCRCDLRRGGERPVADVMSTEVFAVEPRLPIGMAATAMQRLKLGCLPVLSGMLVVGLIARDQLLRAGVPEHCLR